MSNHPLVLRMRMGQGATPLAALSRAVASPSATNGSASNSASPHIASPKISTPPANSRKVSVMTGRLARSIGGYQTQTVQVYDLSSVHFNFEEGPQPTTTNPFQLY